MRAFGERLHITILDVEAGIPFADHAHTLLIKQSRFPAKMKQRLVAVELEQPCFVEGDISCNLVAVEVLVPVLENICDQFDHTPVLFRTWSEVEGLTIQFFVGGKIGSQP